MLSLLISTFGARNDSQAFSKYFDKFYTEQFFPHIQEEKIDTVISLGDNFDRRKYIQYVSLNSCKKFWFDELRNRNITLHCIVGNHDTAYRNTNSVNSPELLLREYDNVIVYSGPKEVLIDNLPIAIIPWICPENYEETIEFIQSTKAQVAMGHLEINGFEMYRGTPTHGGFDMKIFDKFDIVMSGHFHHKSSYGNINYLGAPYEMTWSDWNDPRGYHIFDTDTRELTFYQNRFKMFHKVYYDDSSEDLEEIMDICTDDLKDHIVKVVVKEKNNPYWFDMYISKIEKSGVLDLQVVEDNFNLDLETDNEIIENVEDTLTVLNKYTEQFENRVDTIKLKTFLKDLYQEALSIE